MIGQWEEKVGLEALESGKREGRGEDEDGGRGGRQAMGLNNMARRGRKWQGIS